MKIAILGGYGNTGSQIAPLLAQHTSSSIKILGRNLEKAQELANQLASETESSVSGHYADAYQPDTITPLLYDVDMLVVASGTTDFSEQIATMALDTNTDYFDTNLSVNPKNNALKDIEAKVIEDQKCFITDGGFHPGVPAAMIRLAAQEIPQIEIANVGGSFQLNWKKMQLSKNTMAEFITELLEMKMDAYVNRSWVSSWKNMKWFEFGRDAGRQKCYPFMLDEIRALPQLYPTLTETGFYIAGFSPIVDQVVMPICYLLAKLFPNKPAWIGQIFLSGLRRFASKHQWAILRLDAKGKKDSNDRKISYELFHKDPYALTAIPVVACIMQYIDGHRPPGVWHQAHFVEPNRFFEDIQEMGVHFETFHYLRNE